MTLAVGDPAPPFTLPGTPPGGGVKDYSLTDFAGQPVVLAFYPGDDTAVCTKQLNDYNDGLDSFNELDAQVLGISPQDVESHQRFSSKYGFQFPLLADTDKAVARLYGTLGPIGFPGAPCSSSTPAGSSAYAHRAIAGLIVHARAAHASPSKCSRGLRSDRQLVGRRCSDGCVPPRRRRTSEPNRRKTTVRLGDEGASRGRFAATTASRACNHDAASGWNPRSVRRAKACRS